MTTKTFMTTKTKEITSVADLHESQMWHAYRVVAGQESKTARCGFLPKQKDGEPVMEPHADWPLCPICLALVQFG